MFFNSTPTPHSSRAFFHHIQLTASKNAAVCLLILSLLFSPVLSIPVMAQTDIGADQTILLDPAAADKFAVNGKAYVLYDAQSKTFLLGKNPDQSLAPASITKVMTVLLALEKLKLTDTITVTSDMYKGIPNDYVRLGLVEGETITVEQALYASLLISANDTAMALALTMSDSVVAFAEMMNTRARELGCADTHFTNPYGLADAENLTTAHDMALILAAALENDLYSKISTTLKYHMPATNKFGSRGFSNGNRFVSTEKFRYEPYIGGKTGFTNLSGHTIVAGAAVNGRTLIGVILGATSSEPRYANLISLFDYGFSAFSTVKLNPADYEMVKDLTVSQISTEIDLADLNLSVSSQVMELDPYVTTTQAREKGGAVSVVGDRLTELQPGLSSQILVYPLYREYMDGTRIEVGTFQISIEAKPEPIATTSETSASVSEEQERPIVGMILRVALVLLAAILVFCIVVIIVINRDKKRRRRRRRSKKPSVFL